ncbi:hypothetical protein P8452_51441 [Trifolium repens]|nr:hypothetical protein P8452_51441 [Trifolium repens]
MTKLARISDYFWSEEIVHIAKGEGITNSISILRADNVVNGNKGNMLYLQDSWTDSYGSMVVYSPISLESLSILMNRGDSSSVHFLSSGFLILLDGHSSNNTIVGNLTDGSWSSGSSQQWQLWMLLAGWHLVWDNEVFFHHGKV